MRGSCFFGMVISILEGSFTQTRSQLLLFILPIICVHCQGHVYSLDCALYDGVTE